MAPISRAALNALKALKIPGGSRASATDVKAVIEALIESLASITDDENQPNGYVGLNAQGLVEQAQLHVVLNNNVGGITMDPMQANNWINSFAGATAWQSMQVSGNKIYHVVNMGTGNLTINYPGAANKIVDLAASLAPASSIVIASQRARTIIDDGVNLIFF